MDLSTLEDLRMEIELSSGSERKQLERTLEVCQEISYLVAEGFVSVDIDHDEEEVRFFVEAEAHTEPLVEA